MNFVATLTREALKAKAEGASAAARTAKRREAECRRRYEQRNTIYFHALTNGLALEEARSQRTDAWVHLQSAELATEMATEAAHVAWLAYWRAVPVGARR